MKVRTNFRWLKPVNAIADQRLGGDKARLFMANEAKRLMNDYVPFDNGALSQLTRVYLENKSGVVHYMSPYAHYQYTGKLYVDRKTGKGAFYGPEIGFFSRKNVYKVASGKALNYSTFRHPLATSQWDKAMLTARKDDLVKAVEKYIKG